MTTQPDIPPRKAINAADGTLLAFLEPWLDAEHAGTALRSQIRAAAAIAVRDAAPHIRADERRRIHETSFSPDDAERLGLFKLAAADGALAERDRIRQLAIKHEAMYEVCVDAATCEGTHQFADLLRESPAATGGTDDAR